MKKTGFTLIELSIVLVIIALVVGGVMAGRNLIEAATIRKQISALESTFQGIHAYKLKYNSIPGDALSENAPSASATVTKQGEIGTSYQYVNGDGKVGNCNTNCAATSAQADSWLLVEPYYFFIDLYRAGVSPYVSRWNSNTPALGSATVPALGTNGQFPLLEVNPAAAMTAFDWGGRGLHLYLGMTSAVNTWLVSGSSTGVMTPNQAYAIDAKMDDGIPGSGSIVAAVPNSAPWSGGNGVLVDTNASQCITSSATNTYNVTNTANRCRLMVKVR